MTPQALDAVVVGLDDVDRRGTKSQDVLVALEYQLRATDTALVDQVVSRFGFTRAGKPLDDEPPVGSGEERRRGIEWRQELGPISGVTRPTDCDQRMPFVRCRSSESSGLESARLTSSAHPVTASQRDRARVGPTAVHPSASSNGASPTFSGILRTIRTPAPKGGIGDSRNRSSPDPVSQSGNGVCATSRTLDEERQRRIGQSTASRKPPRKHASDRSAPNGDRLRCT